MQSIRRAILAATLGAGLLLGLFAAPPAVADVDDFHFASMDVQYTLGRDAAGASTLRVVERLVAVFPDIDQNRGIRRTIPDTYNGQPLEPEFVSLTDGVGNPRPAEVEQADGAFTVTSRADDFVHGEQLYVLTYTLRHVTWRFDDTGEEFYWDVNGEQWAQPFDEVTATLHLDRELAAAMTGALACYQGPAGSTARCEITGASSADGATVTASAQDLGPGETMSIAVGFADGTFTAFDTSLLASPWGWVQSLAGLGLLGSLAAAMTIRARRLRDAPGRPVVIAEYAPPPGLDALRSAVLLGRTNRAIPAELLELAVGGSIRIVEGAQPRFGRPRLRAELVDADRADEDGRMLLVGLFGASPAPGAQFEFGGSNSRMASAAQRLLAWAAKDLRERGMYAVVPRGVRVWPMLVAFVAAIGAFIIGMALDGAGRGDGLAAAIAVTGLPIAAVVAVLVARTPKSVQGAEVRDHLAGLRQFIDWAEADRIRTLQSPEGAERRPIDANDPRQMLHLYETLLPYAVVFGLERKWGEVLADRYGDTTPAWYAGSGGFNAAVFAASISSLSASAASSSSTSGGSGGGGSAGGGGGGGGGGGV